MSEIHVGDIGTVFRVQIVDADGVAIDISAATTRQYIFRKRDKTTLTVNASFEAGGTDGWLTYSTGAGDLDQPGAWQIQARVVEATYTNYSETDTFHVKPNL